MDANVNIRTLAFIGYQMYFNGKTKEELDKMNWVELITEMDMFDRKQIDETNYHIET